MVQVTVSSPPINISRYGMSAEMREQGGAHMSGYEISAGMIEEGGSHMSGYGMGSGMKEEGASHIQEQGLNYFQLQPYLSRSPWTTTT